MLPWLITKTVEMSINLKDKYLPRDVEFGDKMSHSQKPHLIFMFLREKLMFKLVIKSLKSGRLVL